MTPTTAIPTAPPHAAAPLADSADIAALDRMRRVNPAADPLRYLPGVPPSRVPRHVAIIMDGNGRWAQRRGLIRMAGHKQDQL